MLIEEIRNVDGIEYIYHASDSGFYIKRLDNGFLYVDAYDLMKYKDIRKYEETDQKIIVPENLEQK